MHRAKFSLACLLLLSMSCPVSAQNATTEAGSIILDDFTGGASFASDGTYFNFRKFVGDGVGFQNGYSQFGLFAPLWSDGDTVLGTDLRVHLTDNQRVGGNFGLFARRYAAEKDRIFGAHLWWDNDESRFGKRYNQVVLGFETLSQPYDVRVNGYFPIGHDTNDVGSNFLGTTPEFVGHRIVFPAVLQTEEAMPGFDIEYGIPLVPNAPWLRGYAGMYAYEATNRRDPVGFRGRIDAWVSEDLSLSVQVTDDRTFGTNVNLLVDYRFNGAVPTLIFPNWSTRDRMSEPIVRNWRVATHISESDTIVPIINPADGEPYFVVHIDNSNPLPGNGTYENPFNFLPEGDPRADIFLVQVGNTSALAPLDGQIGLFDDQRFLGAGREHLFEGTATLFEQTVTGVFVLPGTENTGEYPWLTSTAGDLITLADNNEVSAFNFIGVQGDAIAGMDVTDFNLNCLNISSSTGRAIHIQDASGTGLIFGEVTLTDNMLGGIVVDSGPQTLDLLVDEVVSTGSLLGPGLSIAANDGDVFATINDITADENALGMRLSANGALLAADVNAGSASSNTGTGVIVTGANDAVIDLDLDDFTADANFFNNLSFVSADTAIDADINNSSFSSSPAGSGIVINMTGGTGAFDLFEVDSNLNLQDGLRFTLTSLANVDANITDSSFSTNGGDGITDTQSDGAVLNLFVDPTQIIANQNGFNFSLTANSVLNATFIEDDLSFSRQNGVLGLIDDSQATLTMTDTPATNSGVATGGDGMNVTVQNSGSFTATVTNGDFGNTVPTPTSGDGVELHVLDGSTATVTLDGTDANNRGGNGILFEVDDGVNGPSDLTLSMNNGSLANNGINALQGSVDGNLSFADVLISRAPASSSGEDGFNLSATNGSFLTVEYRGGGILNSGGNGVNATVDASVLGLTMINSAASNSGQDALQEGNGIVIDVANGSMLDLLLRNGAHSANRETGLLIDVDQSLAFVTLEGANVVSLNGDNGFEFNITDSPAPSLGMVLDLGNSVFSGNGDTGILGTVDNSAVVATGGIVVATGNLTGDGINLDITNGGSFDAAADPITQFNADANVLGNGFTFNVDGANSLLLWEQNGGSFSDNVNLGLPGNFNGIDGTVSNTAVAALDFDGTIVDNNTLHGMIYDVNTGGVLTVDFANGSISNNGGFGVTATVDGAGSIGDFTFDTTTITGNGLGGIDVDYTNGGAGTVTVINTPIDGNGGTGFSFDVSGGSQFIATFTGGSFSGNGTIIPGDGVQGTVQDAGSLADVTFLGSLADGNSRHGFNFNVFNAGALIATMGEDPATATGVSASLNGSNGIRFNAGATGGNPGGAGPGTVANLLMTGNNMFNENGLFTASDGVFFNAADVAEAVAQVAGTVNDNGANGVNFVVVDTTASTTASFAVTGAIDVDGNLANSINTNVDTGVNIFASGVPTIDGLAIFQQNIDGNGGDGVHIELNSSTLVDGTGVIDTTRVTSSAGVTAGTDGDGVFISLTNSTADNFAIVQNDFLNNLNDGLQVDVTNGVLTGLFIDNNGVSATPSPAPLYNIDIIFAGGLTPSQQAIFDQAAQRWQQIIIADVPDVGTIDDLEITASGVFIDGPGGILGQAGPTGLRAGSFLPFSGIMQFDTADLDALETSGQLVDVILHEMGHVIGFGTIWTDLNLLLNPGTADPRFTGPVATAEYNTRFGLADPDVPVENTGGPGTADSHWRETVFTNELMTGFLDSPGPNPLSRITIGSLDDLGYVVDLNAADPFLVADESGESGLHGEVLGTTVDQIVDPFDSPEVIAAAFPNAITNNSGNGVNFNLANGDLVDVVISNNDISGNQGGDGVVFNMTNSDASGAFDNNTITVNGGAGVNFNATAAGPQTIDFGTLAAGRFFRDNVIDGNNGAGVNAPLTENVNLIASFNGNSVTNNVFGVRVDAIDNATYTLDFGNEAGALQNTFDGNSAAGVGITASDTTVGAVTVSNSAFQNTTAGSATFFAGEGFRARLVDNATLDDATFGDVAVVNTSFVGNASHGLSIEANAFTSATGTAIRNSIFTANAGDGVNIFRSGDASTTNTNITNNTVSGNSDGIEIFAASANTTDTYTITSNTIDSNTANGIFLNVTADADIFVPITSNTITGNGGDGIRMTENADTTDSPSIGSVISLNDIQGNGSDGIDITARHEVTVTANDISNNLNDGIFIGNSTVFAVDDAVDDIVNNNVANVLNPGGINNNGGDGIDVNAVANLINIDNNDVMLNGNDGVQLTSATAFLVATVNNNNIMINSGDGVEIEANNTGTFFTNVIAVTNNAIEDSGRRGINLFNKGTTRTAVTITGNNVERSQLEGVYMVNTASTTQDVNANANTALAADGSATADPRLALDITNNSILSNGRVFDSSQVFDTSGLVLRVGTSDATTSAFTPGSLASTSSDAELAADTATTTLAKMIAGGVAANIADNTFGGQFGADVTFGGFVSTVDPVTTSGTWTDNNDNPRNNANDIFVVTDYESDPLARLDLRFVNNSGEGLIATRSDSSQLFYNNSEEVFKSRNAAQDGNDPPGGSVGDDAGIFSATRNRNAAKLADNSAPFDRPNGIGSNVDVPTNGFLFPGVDDQSTFRVSDSGNSFIIITSGFGATVPIGVGFGELNFEWDTLP